MSGLVLQSTWFMAFIQLGLNVMLVQQLVTTLLSSVASSTLTSYTTHIHVFLTWYRNIVGQAPSFPVSPFVLALFFVQRAQSLGAASSVQTVWAALRWAHDFCGNAEPFSDRFLRRLVDGLTRQRAKPSNRKKPISPAMLHKIVLLNAHSEASISQIRTALFLLLGFTGFMRYNELANIRFGDIIIKAPLFLKIKIPIGKTDQLRGGRSVIIAATDTDICPLKVLRLYLSKTGDLAPDAYLFQSLQYSKQSGVFLPSGKPITYAAARKMVDRALQSIGMKSAGFATHSLRSGGATAAAAAGVSERLLQLHGRWASASSKDRYIKEPLKSRMSVSKKILK